MEHRDQRVKERLNQEYDTGKGKTGWGSLFKLYFIIVFN